MDGHQFRGARIHRDMMLVSVVCVVGLSVVSGGGGGANDGRYRGSYRWGQGSL